MRATLWRMNDYCESLHSDLGIRGECDFVLDQLPFCVFPGERRCTVPLAVCTSTGIRSLDEALLRPDLVVRYLRILGIELAVNRDLVITASVSAGSNIDPLVLGLAEVF